MEPETVAKIKSYPEMSEYEAKLLFIRKSATEAYEKGEIQEATKTILRTIVEVAMVSNMSREDIGFHIGNLERARSFLAAFTQGLQIGLATEIEPKIKARREKEKAERAARKLASGDDKIASLIALAQGLAKNETLETRKRTVETVSTVAKVKCPSCQRETLSLKFHKC